MARYADRLPAHTTTHHAPDFAVSAEQFAMLEGELKSGRLPEDARAEMVRICRSYLHWRLIELNAGEKSEAVAIWEECRRRLMYVIELGEGTYPPLSDAGRLIEDAIFDRLAQLPILLTERDLEPAELDAALSAGDIPTEHRLTVTRDFMMRQAAMLRQVIHGVDEDVAALGPGFRPGQALRVWFADMREWASSNGFEHGAAPRGGTSKFASFLFELHATFPEEVRDKVRSAQAMNERISEAGAGGNT